MEDWVEKGTPTIEDSALMEFRFEYNTSTGSCCRNKVVMENKLLSEFEWDICHECT